MNVEPTTLLPTVRGPVLLASLHRSTGTIKLVTYQQLGFFLRLQSSFLLFLPHVSMFLSGGVILPLTLSVFLSSLIPPLPHLALSGQFQFSSKNQHRYSRAERVSFNLVLPLLLTPLGLSSS